VTTESDGRALRGEGAAVRSCTMNANAVKIDRLRTARKLAYASARDAAHWLTHQDWLDEVESRDAWWWRELPGRDREAVICMAWGAL